MWNLHGMGRAKICSTGLGHMANTAAMPMYGKTFKNRLLWIENADDLEGWYAALSARLLLNVFK